MGPRAASGRQPPGSVRRPPRRGPGPPARSAPRARSRSRHRWHGRARRPTPGPWRRARPRPRSTPDSMPSCASPGAGRRPPGARRPRSSSSSGTPATILASGPASRRNARQPATDGSPGRPGTRYRPLPCSSAHAAVVRAPLRAPASTTTVASARPLMIRLRRGNVPRVGCVSGGNSLRTAPPPAAIDRARARCAEGYRRSWPPPMTATVGAPARTAAACAAPSIPSASPDTTVAPSAATPSAMLPGRGPSRLGRPARAHDRDRARPVERRRRHRAGTGPAAAGRCRAAGRGRPRPRA